MPKLDCLVDGSLVRDEILTSLYRSVATNDLVCADVVRAFVRRDDGRRVSDAIGEAGYAVIVKLHDRSRDPLQYEHSGGVDWGAPRLLLQRYGGLLATGSNSVAPAAAM